MKHTILFVVVTFLSVVSYGQKPTIPGFNDADRADHENFWKKNAACKGVPILDTFRTNCPGLKFLQFDNGGDLAFLSKLVKEFPVKYFAKSKMETRTDTAYYVKVPLKSGAIIIFSTDSKKDSRVFLVMPQYYFVMTSQTLLVCVKKDVEGNIIGRDDKFRIENDPIAVIKELLVTKPVAVIATE